MLEFHNIICELKKDARAKWETDNWISNSWMAFEDEVLNSFEEAIKRAIFAIYINQLDKNSSLFEWINLLLLDDYSAPAFALKIDLFNTIKNSTEFSAEKLQEIKSLFETLLARESLTIATDEPIIIHQWLQISSYFKTALEGDIENIKQLVSSFDKLESVLVILENNAPKDWLKCLLIELFLEKYTNSYVEVSPEQVHSLRMQLMKTTNTLLRLFHNVFIDTQYNVVNNQSDLEKEN